MPVKLTDDEIIAAADNWKAWGKQFGWTLRGMGDTFYDENTIASFARDAEGDSAQPFNIKVEMRDDIDKRLTAALAATV